MSARAAGVPYAVGRTDEDLVADCTAALAQIEPELQAAGTPVKCCKLQGTSAAGALHDLVEDEDALLLVVGSGRPPGAGRVLLGSTAQRLLHGSPCPVAVVPHERVPDALRTIGVAYIDGDEGREALRAGHALAWRAGATLRVFTVVKVTPAMYAQTEAGTGGRFGTTLEDVEGEYRARAEQQLQSEVAALGDDVEVEVDAFVGDPAVTLVDVSHQLDLLVCGSRGYGPLRAVLLGSVSRRLAAEAHCPVLVLPHGAAVALAEPMTEAAEPA